MLSHVYGIFHAFPSQQELNYITLTSLREKSTFLPPHIPLTSSGVGGNYFLKLSSVRYVVRVLDKKSGVEGGGAFGIVFLGL